MRPISSDDLNTGLMTNSANVYVHVMGITKGFVLGASVWAACEIMNSSILPSTGTSQQWERTLTSILFLVASLFLALTSMYATIIGTSVSKFCVTLKDLLLIFGTSGAEMLLCILAVRQSSWHLWAWVATVALIGHATKVGSVRTRCHPSAYSEECQSIHKIYDAHLKEAVIIMSVLAVLFSFAGVLMLSRGAGWALATSALGVLAFTGGLTSIEVARKKMVAAYHKIKAQENKVA